MRHQKMDGAKGLRCVAELNNRAEASAYDSVRDWKKGDRVLCKKGPGHYDACIIDVVENEAGGPIYKVHFQRWDSRFDVKFDKNTACKNMVSWSKEKAAEFEVSEWWRQYGVENA